MNGTGRINMANKEIHDDKLITALKQLKVETGSLACLGCGYADHCSTHGCAILRAAVDRISGEMK